MSVSTEHVSVYRTCLTDGLYLLPQIWNSEGSVVDKSFDNTAKFKYLATTLTTKLDAWRNSEQIKFRQRLLTFVPEYFVFQFAV